MRYKLKRRKGVGKAIKGDLLARTKRAFAPTEGEKKTLKKFQKKIKGKLPSRKGIAKLSKKIDFRRLI